jgi:hypothetical protein
MLMSLSIKHLSLTCLVTIGSALALPGLANADPLTDLLCNSGSAQYCVKIAPPAPVLRPPAPRVMPPAPRPKAPPKTTQYYKNCTEVWNAGAGPIYRGQPGYAPHLDRDNDGIGCERDPR